MVDKYETSFEDNYEEPDPYGADMILSERSRQICHEGYDSKNDDQYVHEELLRAGIAYALAGITFRKDIRPINFWPWDWRTFKPYDRIENLVRAGALIAAEIDRLKRMEIK